ncbi:uncharacterized protein LOC134728217 isoform X2 [Mytilus trossulus]|uniref:uncharacterized protein LOC134728217 isoform X2 n=1 Tax=Mytilus trossulus TaxID=6551 RepID=UPI003005CBE0
MSQLSEEESNFLRFYYLNLTIASKAVRVYFDFVHPPSGLAGELGKTSTSVNLKGLRFITKLQLQKLYPSTGSNVVRSEHFDTTLIVCLLRNMTPRESAPITGWDNSPQPGDTSTGADLARVKWYRNKLAHSEVGKLSPADCTQYWGDLEGAIERLGGKTLLKEAQSAQHIVLDKSLKEMLDMVRVCENNVAEHAEKIDNLQLDIDNQKTIKMKHENNIQQINASLQQREGEALKLATELSDNKGIVDKCQEEIEACSKEIEKICHLMEKKQTKALERQNKVDELIQHLVSLGCKHDIKINEFDEQMAIQGTQMAKHNAQLAKYDEQITIHCEQVVNFDGQLAKQEENIEMHDEQLALHNRQLANLDGQLAKHDEKMTTQVEQMAKHDTQLTKYDEQITIHSKHVAKFDGQLAKQGENIAIHDEQLALHVRQLANLDGQLAKHDEKMTTQVEQMAKHDTQMATCIKDIDNMKKKQFDTGVSSVGENQRRLEDDTKAIVEEDLNEDTFVVTKAVTDSLLLLKQNGVLLITGHAEMIYTKDWIGTESSLSYKPLEWLVNRFGENIVKSDFIIKTACQCKLFDTVVYFASSKTFDAYSSLEIFLDDFEVNIFSDLSELCRNKKMFNFLWSKVDSASIDMTPIVILILKKTRFHVIPEYIYNAILPVCLNKESILILACRNAHFYLAGLIIDKSHFIDIQSALIAACMSIQKVSWFIRKFEDSNVEIEQLEIIENILLKFGCEQFDLKTACRQAYQAGNFKIIRWFVQNIDIVQLDLEIIVKTALVGGKIEILEYILNEYNVTKFDKMEVLKYITKYYNARYYAVILNTFSVIWISAMDKSEFKMEEIVKMAYEGKCFELLVWVHLNCKLQISINAEKVFLLACQECRVDVAEWVLQTFDQTSLKIDKGKVFIIACEKICNKPEVTPQFVGIIDWTREVSAINSSDLKSGVLKLISHVGEVTWKIRDDFMDFKMNLVIDILGNNLIFLSTEDIEEIMNKSLQQKYYDLVNWLLENKSSCSFDKQNILNNACADGEIKTLKKLKKEFHCLEIQEAIIHTCSNSWKSKRHCQYIHDHKYMYISYSDDQTIACLDLFLEEIHHNTIDISKIVSIVCEEEDVSCNVMTWILLNLPNEQIPINDVLIACCRISKLNHVKYILHTINNEQFDIKQAFGMAYSMLGEPRTDISVGLCVVDCLFKRFQDKICSLFSDLNYLIGWGTCHLVLFFLEKGHYGITNMKKLLQGAYINGHFKVVQWILAHVDHKELDIQSTFKNTG